MSEPLDIEWIRWEPKPNVYMHTEYEAWPGPKVDINNSTFNSATDAVINKLLQNHMATLSPLWTVHTGTHWRPNYSSHLGTSQDDYFVTRYYGEFGDYTVNGPVTVLDPHKPVVQTTKYDRRYMKKLARKCVSKLGPIPWRVRKLVTQHELKYIERNHNNLRFWCGYPNATVKIIDQDSWRIEYDPIDLD